MQGRECRRSNASTDQWETTREVVAGTAVEPHLRAVLPGDDTKAVVLDLVQPLAARWQLIGFGRKARHDEPGREARLQHGNQIRLANHNCNFYRLKAPVLLPSTHGHDALRLRRGKPRPASKSKPSAGRGAYARSAPCLKKSTWLPKKNGA